jgi:hypothetical protein
MEHESDFVGDQAKVSVAGRDESAKLETGQQTQLQAYVPQALAGSGSIQDAENHLTAAPGFLDWAAFDEATLRPRKNARRSRLDRILSPLRSVGAGLPGNVSVEGLGGIIESAHGIFHSVRRFDFMESERTIYLFPKHELQPGKPLPQRELERYENELFDLTKYDGACDYLTVAAWTEEALSGSVTLYEVLFGDEGEMVGIRPVAAMRDVPRPVLVRMRVDERIKRKAVLTVVGQEDQSFEWKANPSLGPRYVTLGCAARSPSHLRSSSRSHSRHRGPRLAAADGVCATIPQFLALLHSRRLTLEHVKSTPLTPIRTEDGHVKPVVHVTQSPRSSPHEGDGVHVAVLIPDDAPWAEEEIVWTDQAGLAELRQRPYWRVIEPVKRGGRGRNRSRSRRRRGDED